MVTTPQTPTVRHRSEGIRWTLSAGNGELVDGPAAPHWLALEDDPAAVRVKTGHQRIVWRVTVGSRTVFAKVYDESGFRRRWLARLGLSAAKREWRACRAAEARGVPSIRALAVGSTVGWVVGPWRAIRGKSPSGNTDRFDAGVSCARSILLTEGFRDGRRLSDVWKSAGRKSPVSDRLLHRRLIDAAAQLFAAAHDRGFDHGDAHAHNVLVSIDDHGVVEMKFIDLVSATLQRGRLSPRCVQRSLAQFDQYFQHRATRAQRLRFLRSYAGVRAVTADRAWLDALAVAKANHAATLARRWDRRLRGDGRYFSAVTLPDGWRAVVVLRLERRHVFPEPGVPDRTEPQWRQLLPEAIAIAEGNGSRPPAGLRVEVDRAPGLLAALRGSRHRRAFQQCHQRRHRGQAAELLLGVLEHRRFNRIDRTALLHP